MIKHLYALIALSLSGSAFAETNYEIRMPTGAVAASASTVTSGFTFSEIAPSGYSVFLIKGGSLYASGHGNNGALGTGDTTSLNGGFVDIGFPGIAKIADDPIQVMSNYFIDTSGKLWSAGKNNYGQLGLNNTSDAYTFSDTGLTDVIDVAKGYDHALAIKSDGSVWASGRNANGQLGDGTTTDRYVFTPTGLTGAQKVVAGQSFSLVLKTDGSLYGTGLSSNGQLGSGTTSRTTFTYQTMNVADVVTGGYHTIILQTNGNTFVSGRNDWGQLGNGSTAHNTSFQNTGISDVKKVAAQHGGTFILKNNGDLYGAGYNSSYQMGLNNSGSVTSFSLISSNVNDIKASTGGAFLEMSDGAIKVFGMPAYASFNNGSSVSVQTPTAIDTSEIVNW